MTQTNPTRCSFIITKRGAFKGRTVKALCTNHFVEKIDGRKYCAVHARKVRVANDSLSPKIRSLLDSPGLCPEAAQLINLAIQSQRTGSMPSLDSLKP